jgi:hypothetical protein
MPIVSSGVKTYDPKEILLLVAGVPIDGFADGDFINVEFPESFTTQIGAQGAHTRSRVADSTADMTVTLQQTSPGNAYLTSLLAADRALGVLVPVLLKDLIGNDLVASTQAYITQRPALGFGAESGSREWTFKLHNATGGALGQV